jgi:hypothetical protein
MRRALQLGLAAVWLLDGVLQYQPFMYTKAFAQMLGAGAAGNPAVIASPITWDANLVQHHLVLLNTVFATIQLLLGIGIAFRPTVRVALAGSIAWSLAVWWFGEGLGGVLNGGADPLNGAPGAVILYALLAVLLWPADRPGKPAPFIAARAVGAPMARALWLVLWLSFGYFALLPANRAPQAISGMIASMNSGELWPVQLLRERRRCRVADGQSLAILRDPVAVRHADARGGAIPGEDHVVVEIRLGKVRQFAIGRAERARVLKLQLLDDVRHPAFTKAFPGENIDASRAEERPQRHFYGAGVGARGDADAVVGGNAQNFASKVDCEFELGLADLGAMRAAKRRVIQS